MTVTTKKKSRLKDELIQLDNEFSSIFKGLDVSRSFPDSNQSTYSPLDVVSRFEQRGLQQVREVNRDEMLQNERGMKKLLANMLSQCRPGAISQEDHEILSGINGREVQADL